MFKYYQQGDVLLFKTNDKFEKGYYKYTKTNILQHGEATGHAHRIESPGFKLYDKSFSSEKLLILKKFGLLSHEEHKTIKLPPGSYKIRIVNEYDHFREETRKVRD